MLLGLESIITGALSFTDGSCFKTSAAKVPQLLFLNEYSFLFGLEFSAIFDSALSFHFFKFITFQYMLLLFSRMSCLFRYY